MSKTAKKTPSTPVAATSYKIAENLDEEILALLTEVSSVLIGCGYTAGQFGDIAKRSFVDAASRLSRLRNGRVNQSRVAAITGLTRVEVKRLLVAAYRSPSTPLRSQHRALRVLEGWRSDPDFNSRRGVPRRLTLFGPNALFRRLVRRYSGDIPPRVILEELQRLRLISVRGNYAGLRAQVRSSHSALQLGRSLISALSSVSGGWGGPRLSPLRISTRELQIACDELGAKMLRRRTHENLKAFLASTEEAVRPISGARSKARETCLTRLTVVISESKVAARASSKARAESKLGRSPR